MSCGKCEEDTKTDNQPEGTKAGKVDHFFDKISVAVVVPEIDLKVGDVLKFYDKEGNEVLEQEISSMQVDHKEIDSAKKGEEFGMKVDAVVKEGYEFYKQ